MAQSNPFLQSPFDDVAAQSAQDSAALLPGQQPVKATPQIEMQQSPARATPQEEAPATAAAPKKARAENWMPPADQMPIFEAAAQHFNVPVNVLMALGNQESRYRANAIGVPTKWGRAKGIMQYLDSTAQGLGINPFDPAEAIPAAAKQLRERLDAGASMKDAVMEHFAGPDRKQWGAKTAAYGDEVMEKVDRIGQLYSGSTTPADHHAADAKPDLAALQKQLDADEPGRYKVLPEGYAEAHFSSAMPRDTYEQTFRSVNPGASQSAIDHAMGQYDARAKAKAAMPSPTPADDRFKALTATPEAQFDAKMNRRLQGHPNGIVPPLPAQLQPEQVQAPSYDANAADNESALSAAASYLGKSFKAGAYDLAGAGAKVLDEINPWTLSPSDAAVLFKNDPAKLKQFQDDSAAMILSRFAKRMTNNSEESMKEISDRAKRDYGSLEYATTDTSKAAYLSPTKVIGDALRSLPTSAAMAVSVYLTRGAAARAEQTALAAGMTPEMAKQAAVAAGAKAMATTGAASEGVTGYAQQANQSAADAEKVPMAELAKSPKFQQLLQKGFTPEAARAKIIADTGEEAGRMAGIVDAAVNHVGGQFLGKILTEGGKLIPRIMKGAANESATEFVQSAGEQLGQNKATRDNINQNQSLTEGVGEAAIAGAAVGGVMGGSMAGAGGKGAEVSPAPSAATAQAAPAPVVAAGTAPVAQASTAPGPLSRSVENAAEQHAGQENRVTATAPTGEQVSGQIAGYQEDADGNFVAQIVADDGTVVTLDSRTGVQIEADTTPDAGPLTASLTSAAEQHAEAPSAVAEDEAPVEQVAPQVAEEAPAPIPKPTIPEMSDEQLRDRLKYIASQAKDSGWDKRFVAARKEVEREINKRAKAAPTTEASNVGTANDGGRRDLAAAPDGSPDSGRLGADRPLSGYGSADAGVDGAQAATDLPAASGATDAKPALDKNGFIGGKDGKRVRISQHKKGSNQLDPSADVGAFTYEIRSGENDKNPLLMVLNKYGKLVSASSVLNGNESNGAAWVPPTKEDAETVQSLLEKRATTEIGTPERKAIDEQISAVVKGESKSSDQPALKEWERNPYHSYTAANQQTAEAYMAKVKADPEQFEVKQTGKVRWQVVQKEVAAPAATPAPAADLKAVSGRKLDKGWTAFKPSTGTLDIPRAKMPQVKSEHRGAMVNFLNARGITHEQVEVPAGDLKPTQREFSAEKVAAAKDNAGGERSILISSDNHVLDGHHQWLAQMGSNEPVKAIRLNAPIRDLLLQVHEFPSSMVEGGATKEVEDKSIEQINKEFKERDRSAGADKLRSENENSIYVAGAESAANGEGRTPPAFLAGQSKDLWLSGYDSKEKVPEVALAKETYKATSKSSKSSKAVPTASRGHETSVRINKEKVAAHWEVVEAKDLNATIGKAENQYRDRTRAASQAQISQIASAPAFDMLADSPVMDFGAPTLAKDGKTIIGGNGRFAGLVRAYEQGTADDYRAELETNAQRYGVSTQGMKHPVLVRRFADDVNIKEAAIASNEGGGLKMSALEQAKVDAERMGDMADFIVGDNGEVNNASNQHFIRSFMGRIPQNQQASFVDADGKLSQEGIQRIRNAVLYRAYGDSPTLTRMVESADPGLRNVVTALLRVAPKIADVKARIADGDLHDLDISGELIAAVEQLNKLRSEGTTIDDYINQLGLFGDTVSDEVASILRYMDANTRSAKAIADFLGAYYDGVLAVGSPKQDNMFGATAVPTRQEIINEKAKRQAGDAGKQSDIFANQDAGGKTQGQPKSARTAAASDGEKEVAARFSINGDAEISDASEQVPADEAKKVQSAVEGKRQREIADWLEKNAPSEAHRMVAGKVAEAIRRMESEGAKFNFRVAHMGEVAHSGLDNALAVTHFGVNADRAPIADISVNGTDVSGRVGVGYEPILHELVHAVTAVGLELGMQRQFANTDLGHAAEDLKDIRDLVLNAVAERVYAGTATRFEKRIQSRRNNGMANIHEITAWSLTNSDMQKFMESIKVGQQTAWSKFVSAIRKMLGLPAKNDTALSEVLHIAEKVMDTSLATYLKDLRYDPDLSIVEPANSKTVGRNIPQTMRDAYMQQAGGGKDVTDTPAFRKWFNGSKIVDSSGKPLVLYHGTSGDFSEFDIEKSGKSDNGYYGSGFYFTAAPSTASSYHGHTVMPVYLSIKNPYYWPEGRPSASDIHETEKITRDLIKAGHDGVVVKNEELDDTNESNFYEVIAFTPTQIKSAIGNNGDFDASNPDIRYSVSGDDRDLMITHNLTAANLMHAHKMGGIAVPSLAVVKKDSAIEGFGEITMIGSNAMADPKGYAKTQVFGADIYSPRYPSVEVDVDAKAKKAFDKQFGKMADRLGTGLPDTQDIERKGVEAIDRSLPVMAQFVQDNGIEPNIVMVKGSLSEERIKRLEKFGLGQYLNKTSIYELIEDTEFVKRAAEEAIDSYRSRGDERMNKMADKMEADPEAQKNVARDIGYKIIFDAKQRIRPEVERYTTQTALDKQIKDAGLTDKFNQFAADTLASMSKGERIFKGFSNSGKRTYTPHTLENVVSILKKELRGGENFNYGVGSLRAKFTPQFKTVAQIKKEKGRLVSKEQFEAVKKEIDEEFFAVGNAISDKANTDTIIGILEDAPKMGLERAAKQYGIELSDDAKQKAAEFLTRLHHLPTEYFEAKILRDVDLSEFSGAVIPKSTPQNVRDVLAKRGIPVREYENEADRRKVVEEFSSELDAKNYDVLFSIGQKAYSVDNGTVQAEFGPVHTEFRNDTAGAVKKLMADKDGEAIVHRDDVGDISLVYGDGNMGLSHIVNRRGSGFVDRIPALLRDGSLYSKPSQKDRVFIGTYRDEAVLRFEWDGKAKTWLLSAYEKYPDLKAAGDVRESRRSQVVDERSAAPMDKDALRSAVTGGVLGKVVDSMIDAGVVVLHDTPKTLPIGAGRNIKGVQAVTMPDGKIHLVASNLTEKNANAVMLHEAFHEGAEKLLGTDQWGALMGRLGSMYRQGEQSSGKAKEFFDKARQRVASAKAKGGVSTKMEVEEFAAYAIEEYESVPASVKKWVDDLLGMVKAWLAKRFGKQIGAITPAQLSAFAKWAVMDHAIERRGEIFGDHANWFSLGQSITDTPKFRKWFGESKVVDENGQPLVLYHGTDKDFSTFAKGITDPIGFKDGQGHYFTREPEYAGDYGATVMPVYLTIKNPYMAPLDQFEHTYITPSRRAELEAAGHDGVIFEGNQKYDSEYVVFDSEQIKSAIGNNGDFDPSNPDIRYSVGNEDRSALEDALDNLLREDLEDSEVFSREMPKANNKSLTYLAKIGQNVFGTGGVNVSVRSSGDDAGVREYGSHEFFFHDSDGVPVGFARLTKNPSEASINMIAFNEDSRGQGYGKAFYKYLLDDLGLSVKTDSEITEGTAALYKSLLNEYDGEVLDNGRVRIVSKQANQGARYSLADDTSTTTAPTAPQEPNRYTPPEQGVLRRTQAAIQDNLNRVTQVQNKIKELTGRTTLGKADYRAAEVNRPGRIAARLEDFRDHMMDPLIAKLANAGYKPEQLAELLHAMRALDINPKLAKINPRHDPSSSEYSGTQGSGMNDDVAKAILDKYKNEEKLHDLADQARAIARLVLDLKLKYGLISKDGYDQIVSSEKYYVPLKGDAGESKSGGGGKGGFGPQIKRIMGHGAREENILENIARDYEQATVVGEKNLARQSLLQMVLKFADPELWTVGMPPRGRYMRKFSKYVVKYHGSEVANFNTLPEVRAFLDGEMVRSKDRTSSDYAVETDSGEKVKEFAKPLQDNEVMVYVNGDPVRLQIHDEKLATQLRPLDAQQLGPILEQFRKVNRYLSSIYTGYNPAFILRNATRDAITGTINMLGNEGAAVAAKAWRQYPAAVAALGYWAQTKKAPDSKTGRYLTEYRMHGGKVGASYMSDLEQQGEKLQFMYDKARGLVATAKEGSVKRTTAVAWNKTIGKLAHVVEVANQATENGLRLGLFIALREEGVSADRAAQAAKGVTVDFDRKGATTGVLGAIYLFFNPAVQGTANAMRTLMHGQHKAQAWAALGGLVAAGFWAASKGMDDDKDKWLGEGWETRTKNLIVNTPGHQFRAPMSQEFAPAYAFGVALAEASRGESKVRAAAHIISSFIDAYFPLQGAYKDDSDNHLADAAQAATPTVLKPLIESAMNRNSFGSQVVPESELTKDKPDNLKMNRGTKNTAYDKAAQGIAAAGESIFGAGKYENDITKVSPETLKSLWRTYTGGLGQFITDSAGLAKMGVTDSGQLESSDIPFLKDFYRTATVNQIRGRYYDLSKDAKAAITEFEQAKKLGDGEELAKIADGEKGKLIGLGRMVRSITKAAAALGDEKVEVNANKDLTDAEKRAELKRIEKDEEELYRSGIEAFK